MQKIRFSFGALLALVMVMAGVLIPTTAKPAQASVLPLLLWSNKALPTQNPNINYGSVWGWKIASTNAPGIWSYAIDALYNQTVPAGHVQYVTQRAAGNSCHTFAVVAWIDQGAPVRGAGIWDNCVYNGWIWFRLYDEMNVVGPDHYIWNGRLAPRTLKSGSTWQTEMFNHSIQAWILLASTTGSSSYADGEAAFRYTQHSGSGGCAALPGTRIDQVRVNTTGGWVNAGTYRTKIKESGCFTIGPPNTWSYAEWTTWPNMLRAQTPNP